MPGSDTAKTVTTHFAFRDEADGYVLALIADGIPVPLLEVTVSQDVVETSVLRQAALALELRPNGSVVAYSEAAEATDLATIFLGDLVNEALAVADAEDAELLAALEVTLQQALETTRATRARLAKS